MYVAPKKKETKEKKKESDEEKTAPSEYHGPELTEVERKDVGNKHQITQKAH